MKSFSETPATVLPMTTEEDDGMTLGYVECFTCTPNPSLWLWLLLFPAFSLAHALGEQERGGRQQKPQAKHLSHRMRRVGNARGRRKSDNVNHSGHAMAMAMTMKYEICNPRRRQQQQQQQQQVEEEA